MHNVVLLAELWEENQEYLKQYLGESDSRAFGARWVYMPTVPFPRFCHVSRIRLPGDQVDDLIASARAFFGERGLSSYALMTTPATRPADLGMRLYRQGFLTETNPVMVWNGTPLPLHDRPDLRVVQAEPRQIQVVWEMIRQVFFAGASAEVLADGREGVERSDEIGAINFIAYLGTTPVGACTLFPHGGMGGIYNMCTLPRYQRQGVATALLRAAVEEADRQGCIHVGLTPTPAGRPLYERLGFEEIYQEIYFAKRIE